MLDAKPCPTPMSSNTNLSLPDVMALKNGSDYRCFVGVLQYYTMTRPDIAFAVNKVCQFMHHPSDVHWQAVKLILRYLNGTSHFGIFLQPSFDFNITSYTNVHWASYPDDRHNTSGYYLFFGSNMVSWSSSKQKVVSQSSTELEYQWVANRAIEIAWIESLLRELSITPTRPPLILYDNINATYLATNPILHARTKHVEIDYHFVRECVLQRSLSLYPIHTF
ncbi:hypothetical protein VitviT2T_020126 [Vitis vinifera]|uniref:Retrovirus-related Pol polyprotein from transposon RE2 n=1 Tax=Vitis vinifera TaxID=29760 RepID=A0ABY9D4M5_VITVI|nr:hypothetical protein VitviT2T_020126 [Vitis vinifera]